MHMSIPVPAFFEGDLVLRGEKLMTVLSVDEGRAIAECFWYVVDGRRTGRFPFSELRLLVASQRRGAKGHSPPD